LQGVGAVRAALRIPRGLRVFEHRVHVHVACTRSCSDRPCHSRWVCQPLTDLCGNQHAQEFEVASYLKTPL
jgi:hypothetical protein